MDETVASYRTLIRAPCGSAQRTAGKYIQQEVAHPLYLNSKGPYPLGPSVAERSVCSEISNMLDISWWSPRRRVTAATWQSVAQLPNK